MLNQHKNLLVPESDRLRIGECVVDIPRREVCGGGAADAPRRLTVKALQVLLVLVAHRGRMVSREALLEWVWADTMPGDDVLTQAVAQLRRAFGDDRDHPRYLETIAKGGYRLLADVAWLPGSDVGAIPKADAVADGLLAAERSAETPSPVTNARAAGDPQPPATKPRAFMFAYALLALVLAAALALGVHGWRSSSRAPADAAPQRTGAAHPAAPALAYQRVATLPVHERRPSLSPDGGLLAYVVQDEKSSAVYVQSAAAVAPTRLTEPPSGYGDMGPRWSPDGREIMFMRWSEDSRCEFQLVPASGGQPRAIGSCSGVSGEVYDWLPDGSGLIAGIEARDDAQRGARLHVLDIATGAWRPLAYAASRGDTDLDPHVSPDGRWIAFRRNISNADLWRMPIGGGTPERLTRLLGNIHGLDWTPDGKVIVFSRMRDSARLYRLDVATRQVTAMGVANASYPDIAARAPVMAFETVEGQAGLYRRRLPSGGDADAAERLFASSGSELLPSPSPDGRQLAFYSDRTGELQLWLGRVDDPRSLRAVSALTPVPRQPARWLDDGNTLLVVGTAPESGNSDPPPALFAIDARAGRAQRLPVPTGLVPVGVSPMPGERMLLVADTGEGRLSMRVFDTAVTPWRELARRDNVGEARYDRGSDSVWFAQADRPGLWRSDAGLQHAVAVNGEYPDVYWMRQWLVVQGKPYTVQPYDENCAMTWAALGAQRPMRCLEPRIHFVSGEPLLSNDGGWLYYSAAVREQNTDISLAKLP